MSKQPNSLSENPRISQRAYHAVGGALSHPDARLPAIGRDTYSNVVRPVAGLAGPSTDLPPENFFKNILLREVKDPAIRISVGDHFGMEEAINPCHRSFSCQVPRSRLGSADQPAKGVEPVAHNVGKDARVPHHGLFFGAKKNSDANSKKFLPIRSFCRDLFSHDERPKAPAPPCRSRILEPLERIFWKARNTPPFAVLSGTMRS